MGGLKMNNKGEILNTENNTIYGLFGAGEVTGGVHGGNRLGGNSLAECGVYGKISADSAVDYLLNKDNIIINSSNISDIDDINSNDSSYSTDNSNDINNDNNSDNNSDNDIDNDDNKNSSNINQFFIQKGSSNGLGAGGIIAIIVACAVALIALLLCVLFCKRKRNNMQLGNQLPMNSLSNNPIIFPSK